jgi:MinD superfamily P-loop ATPase
MTKQVVVLSGKGGAGKTIVSAALAPLAAQEFDIVLADADVDASNLELLLSPTIRKKNAFISGHIAQVDDTLCERCGACRDACRFDAIHCPEPGNHIQQFRVDPTACEGCGACMFVCPLGSISMEPVQAGEWYYSETRFGPLFHAHLYAGKENSGKLVTAVRRNAAEMAKKRGSELVLIDGPPGIGCPVVSAITGADLALLVAEPTISGEHDLERVLDLTRHFGVTAAVILNKADLNPARAGAIESYCREHEVALLGRIPYDRAVDDAIVQGIPLTEYGDAAITAAFDKIWCSLRDSMLEPGKLRLIQ